MPPYDLFSPKFKTDPFLTFAHMRHHAPIYPHRTPKGETVWYITRYDDVLTVLKDTDNFIKDQRNLEALERKQPFQPPNTAINQNMLFSDPPAHTRLRSLVNQAFTSRRVDAMQPHIQAIADRLLDQVAPQGAMDLIAAYALPLPVIVICDLLGIPADDQDAVCDWSQAIISPGRQQLNFSKRRRIMKRFIAYVRHLIQTRQQNPIDDLISALVQAEETGGDKLSAEELSGMVALLLVTGHETTVNLIGNAVLALLQNPDQLALLRDSPSLIDQAIEELLRYDGPVETSTTRWVKRDLIFQGHKLRRGDIVRVVLSSANRDSAQFSDPDRLDFTRKDNRHLAFGHGIHYCLGAPLARLEGRVALQTLFHRCPNLRLDTAPADLRWRPGVLFRGLDALPVAWG